MADKKVERSGRERPLTPTQKMTAALSDSGTMDMADRVHDKGRSALVDRFREREEKWRQEQTFHDREAAQAQEKGLETLMEEGATDRSERGGEGGAR